MTKFFSRMIHGALLVVGLMFFVSLADAQPMRPSVEGVFIDYGPLGYTAALRNNTGAVLRCRILDVPDSPIYRDIMPWSMSSTFIVHGHETIYRFNCWVL